MSLVRIYGKNHLEAFRDEEAERRAQQQLEQQLAEQQQQQFEEVKVEAEVITLPSSTVSTVEPLPSSTQVSTESNVVSTAASSSEPTPTSFSQQHNSSTVSTDPLIQPSNESPTFVPPLTSHSSSNITSSHNIAASHKESMVPHSADTTSSVPNPSRPTPQASNHYPHGESIYGAITKRLTVLERDVALTLNYIEEQSRLFQDLFAAIEKRLVERENGAYRSDQLLRRLMLDQELHRAQIENERTALASQVNVLAEEVCYWDVLFCQSLTDLIRLFP